MYWKLNRTRQSTALQRDGIPIEHFGNNAKTFNNQFALVINYKKTHKDAIPYKIEHAYKE